MLTGLGWLALEVKYLEEAGGFYREHLDLPVQRADDGDIALSVGQTDLVLRRPSGVPRGGLHTHYAFAIPPAAYDDWWDRLEEQFDLEEHQFGTSRSLYFDDTEGNCVELGQRSEETGGQGITGIFEIVLEVEDLAAAEAFYTDLGLDPVDRGEARRRVRLTAGPFDVELWEPQLGLADARGGVHVDLGIDADDPEAVADRVADRALRVETLDADGANHGDAGGDGGGGGDVRVKDPDGHYLTFR